MCLAPLYSAKAAGVVCSTTKRAGLNVNLQTYSDMYKPTDLLKKYFIKANVSIDWGTKVSWMDKRNDNKKWGCNNWNFIGTELAVWDAFWLRHAYSDDVSHAQAANVVNNLSLSLETMTKMQDYIRKTCGLDMWSDWQLWKKTVNSTQLCQNLPCKWYCGWDWFSDHIDDLYIDEPGTKKMYDGTDFLGDPSQTLYIASGSLWTQPYSDGLKPIKKAIDSSDVCRNTLLASVSETVYLAMKPYLTIVDKCCYNWPIPTTQLPSVVAPTGWLVTATTATYTSTAVPIGIALPVPSVPVCVVAASSPATGAATEPCRFNPPTDPNNLEIYTKAKNDPSNVEQVSCEEGCPKNSKEVMKWWAALCEKCDIKKCNCGIKLNTNVPFIGRCIMNESTNDTAANGEWTITVNWLNAFPVLMGAMIKILMSIIMIICFASLIVWGFMMTIPDQYDMGKNMIKKVVRTIAALWTLWTILYLVNPNFFT